MGRLLLRVARAPLAVRDVRLDADDGLDLAAARLLPPLLGLLLRLQGLKRQYNCLVFWTDAKSGAGLIL